MNHPETFSEVSHYETSEKCRNLESIDVSMELRRLMVPLPSDIVAGLHKKILLQRSQSGNVRRAIKHKRITA
ncbi:MAG: hypothetical protein AABZ62_01550 [Planctomycetota bacterium]